MNTRRFAIGILAAVLAASSATATQYWDPGEPHPLGPPVPPRLGYGAMAQGYDADMVYGKACAFIEEWQVKDPNDPNYGGIREGEDLPNIIQSDNTQESVWVWSRWHGLTGSTDYDDAIKRSWTYLDKNPAWNEEGWERPDGKYYRLYNCGWGMRAEMMYRHATGDQSRKEYGRTCARFVAYNPVDINPVTYRNNFLCAAWAVGNLYEYATDVGDNGLKNIALTMAGQIKTLTENAPAWCIGGYSWAMAGGAVIWGLHNSYFKEHPDEEKAWMTTYAAYLPAEPVEPSLGSWDNAWNGWFMLGHYAAYHATLDDGHWAKFENVAGNLVIQDTDGDGGIPPSQGLDDTHDHTWVTSYMIHMGMDRIIRDLSVKNLAAAAGRGEIILSWEPAFEERGVGYNVYREAIGTPGRPKINADPLAGDPPYEIKDEHVTPGRTYKYWLEALSAGENTRVNGPVEVKAGGLPNSFVLAQNYPNPCAGRTTVEFALGHPHRATFRVFDLAGRMVYYHDGDYTTGKHELHLNLNVPPGVYIYELKAGDDEAARSMVVVD
jgi:hypothetical protein